MISINRNDPDVFCRYKMPKIQTKIEGKGNGIKTVLVNVSDVARALDRPIIYLMKYFSFELGAQIKIDKKVKKNLNTSKLYIYL